MYTAVINSVHIGQADLVVDIEPFRVVVYLVSFEGHSGHESKGLWNTQIR